MGLPVRAMLTQVRLHYGFQIGTSVFEPVTSTTAVAFMMSQQHDDGARGLPDERMPGLPDHQAAALRRKDFRHIDDGCHHAGGVRPRARAMPMMVPAGVVRGGAAPRTRRHA